jgi:hypothetical protein
VLIRVFLVFVGLQAENLAALETGFQAEHFLVDVRLGRRDRVSAVRRGQFTAA